MIALFDEPPRVSITDLDIGRNGLLIGMAVLEKDRLVGIVVRENGEVGFLPLSTFLVDYRYDVEADRWIDTNAAEADQA